MKGTNRTWYEIVISPCEVENKSVEGFELKDSVEASCYLHRLLNLANWEYPKCLKTRQEWGMPTYSIYKWVNKEEGEDPIVFDRKEIEQLPKYVQKRLQILEDSINQFKTKFIPKETFEVPEIENILIGYGLTI